MLAGAVLALMFSVSAVNAQTMTPLVTDMYCSSAQNHNFDFWVGDWTVRDAAGVIQGHNLVTHENGIA